MSQESSMSVSQANQYQSEEILWKIDEDDQLRAYHVDDPDTPVTWAPQPGSQTAFLTCSIEEVLLEGNRGGGKLQPLDAKILTPRGWTTMGKLKVGTLVQTPKGHAAPVTHIFEHKQRDIYRVTFHDGSSTEAGDEHLWKFKVTGLQRKGVDHNWNIHDTMRMKERLDKGWHVLIPTVDPLPMYKPTRLKEYAIDPYMLGMWLGDGHAVWKKRMQAVGFTSRDEELLQEAHSHGFTDTTVPGELRLYKRNDKEGIWSALEKLKLEKAKAKDKFIPFCYKQAPIHVRLAILQGLMDTDGTCSEHGHPSFTSVSKRLARDVQEIVWSLGGKATLTQHPSFFKGKRYLDHFDVYIQAAGKFQPFRLKRKQDRVYPFMHPELCRRVVSIDYVGKKDARCIRINDLEHLYITDDFTVTHNTDVLLMDFAQHVGRGFGKDWTGILFRQTFPELEDVIKKANIWFTEIFPQAKYNKGKYLWEFPEGEMLRFAHAENIDHYSKYHGHSYPWMAWEELTNWPDDTVFKKIISLNRSTNKKVPLKIRSTTNPSGRGHNWVKARYKLPSLPGEMTTEFQQFLDKDGKPELPCRISIQSRLDENKVLMHADPYYINKIRASCNSPEELEAHIGGNWNITSGGMFDDLWDPEVHIIMDLTVAMIPQGWYMDRSYDHGQSAPFSVGFWAESNGEPIVLPSGRILGQVRGDLIRFREWYGCDPEKENTGVRMSATNIAKGINERVASMDLGHRIRTGIADGSIFDLYEPGKSVEGDMRKEGVKWKPADKSKGSRKHGWQQIRTRLQNAIPEQGLDGNYIRERPGLFIAKECKDFIRTFPVLSRSKKDADDVDTDIEDHIADEVRYRCRAQLRKRTFVRKG